MLDSYFKLTNISYLIHRLWYDLIRFFDYWVVAYFFGATLYVLIQINGDHRVRQNDVIATTFYVIHVVGL